VCWPPSPCRTGRGSPGSLWRSVAGAVRRGCARAPTTERERARCSPVYGSPPPLAVWIAAGAMPKANPQALCARTIEHLGSIPPAFVGARSKEPRPQARRLCDGVRREPADPVTPAQSSEPQRGKRRAASFARVYTRNGGTGSGGTPDKSGGKNENLQELAGSEQVAKGTNGYVPFIVPVDRGDFPFFMEETHCRCVKNI